jgi:hypothetical protein
LSYKFLALIEWYSLMPGHCREHDGGLPLDVDWASRVTCGGRLDELGRGVAESLKSTGETSERQNGGQPAHSSVCRYRSDEIVRLGYRWMLVSVCQLLRPVSALRGERPNRRVVGV